MRIGVKFIAGKNPSNCRKSFFVSLMVALLISSLIICTFAGQAVGQSTVNAATETELRAAVNNAANGVSTVIVLTRDIGLTGSALTIPANKDITLRSNGNAEYSLFGVSGASTITVENNGKLTLAGITVTHVSGASGNGVTVNSGGTFFMSGGKISGNGANNGVGVSNRGAFTLTGGEISNNNDYGVYNDYGGAFSMSGGKISNNRYGVYAYYSTFTMNNGKISDNTHYGVSTNFNSAFNMLGGEISSNGFGVDNYGTFTMSNGVITENNGSTYGGGVRNRGTFSMSGGEISKNGVIVDIFGGGGSGGGVSNSGTFTMTGGEISKNTALYGGGVCVDGGNFNLHGGKISGNTATRNGGGVWVTDTVTNFNRLIVRDGVVFADNRASAAYNRAPVHDSIYRAYIGDNVKWSEPFTQGYNNFDISYVYGTSITLFTVTVNDAYGTPTGAGSYSVGETVTLNAGTRNGYNFVRWTVNSGGITLPYNAGVTTTFIVPTNNVVVTASWSAIQYSITYALNGGSATGNPTSYNAGNLPITINNPTRAGYDFTGWTVKYANNTEITGQTGYRIPTGSYGNVVLTANWGTPSTDGGSSSGGSGGGSSSGSGSNNSGSGGSSSSHNNPDNSGNGNNNNQHSGNVNSYNPGSIGQIINSVTTFFKNLIDWIIVNSLIIIPLIIVLFVALIVTVKRSKKQPKQVNRRNRDGEQPTRRTIERHGYAKTNALSLLTAGWYGISAYDKIVKDVNYMSVKTFGQGVLEDIHFSPRFTKLLFCPAPVSLLIWVSLFGLLGLGIIPTTAEDMVIEFGIFVFIGFCVVLLVLLGILFGTGRAIDDRLAIIVRGLGPDILGYANYARLERLCGYNGFFDLNESKRCELFNELAEYFDPA